MSKIVNIVNIILRSSTADDAAFRLQKYSKTELTKLLSEIMELLSYMHDPHPSVYEIYKKLGIPNTAELFANVNGKIDHIDDIAKDIRSSKETHMFTSGWHNVSNSVFEQLKDAIDEYGVEDFISDVLLNPAAVGLLKTYIRIYDKPLYTSLKRFRKDIDQVLSSNITKETLRKLLKLLYNEVKRNNWDYNKVFGDLIKKYRHNPKVLEIIRLAEKHHIPKLLKEFINEMAHDQSAVESAFDIYRELGVPIPK